MTDLMELASRVEAGEGPDRELDARIWCIVGNDLGYDDPPQKHRLMRPLQPRICIMGRWLGSALEKYPEDIDGVAHVWRVPAFTASTDAAMSLVPEGWGWQLSQSSTAGAWLISDGQQPIVFDGMSFPGVTAQVGVTAATPARALTAACLRARAHQGAAHVDQ